MTNQHEGPRVAPIHPLMERWVRLMTGEEGRGRVFGHWVGRTFGTRDLRRRDPLDTLATPDRRGEGGAGHHNRRPPPDRPPV